MSTKICEKCDHEMKLIPAGISRAKNKPYPAFWSCHTRNGGCGATAKAEGVPVAADIGTAGSQG